MKSHEVKPESVMPLSRFDRIQVAGLGLASAVFCVAIALSTATHGLSSAALGVDLIGVGIGIRFVKALDILVVSRMALGTAGVFSKSLYKAFRKSPLRIYTINHLAWHVEQLAMSADERAAYAAEYRAAKKELTGTPLNVTPEVTSKFATRRTADFLARISDPRRHLDHIVGAALAAVPGVRLLGELANYGDLSVLRFAAQVAVYTLELGYSVGHVDAYIQRRAAETSPRPLFVLADKFARKISFTRFAGNLYIRWDRQKIRTLEAGDQLWRWRAQMALARRLPSFLGTHSIRYLDRRKMKITPQVVERLKELKVLDRVENLKAVADHKTSSPLIQDIKLRAAYADLVTDTDARLALITEQYRAYAAEVAKRNAAFEKRDGNLDQTSSRTVSRNEVTSSLGFPLRPSGDKERGLIRPGNS